MPQTGHIRINANGPATSLVVSLEFAAANDIHEVLTNDGVVEANAEFAAAASPADAPGATDAMVNATPAYLEGLAAEMQRILNEVACEDLPTLVAAMLEAGTPEEIGAAAWAQVEDVLAYVTGDGYSPTSSDISCVEFTIGTPGG